jgi:hypothetical protein
MKKRDIILTLLVLLPAFIGCTKEDYRNCPDIRPDIYVVFEPTNPKHILRNEVQNASLYLYDPAMGDLARELHYLKSELRQSDMAAPIPPEVPAGTYRLVAILNDGIYTTTTGTENYSTLKSSLNNADMDYKPVDFYASEKMITVADNITTVETMPVIKHNNNIHLNIIYDGYVATPGVTFTSWIESPDLYFEYETGVNSLPTHFMPWEIQTGVNGMPVRFSFTSMRLTTDNYRVLHLQETAATRALLPPRHYKLVLADELAKIEDPDNPGEFLYDTDAELEFYDEFELTIKLGKDNIQIAVGVDRWDTIGGGVEL